MKATVKRLISLILAVVILAVPAMSAAAYTAESEKYPVILIPGIMAADVYVDVNNPDAGLAWPPSGDAIVGLVADCIPALMEFSVTRDWEKLGNTLSPLAYELFAPAMCNPDGSIPENSGIIFEYPTIEEIEAEDDYIEFLYDWRQDPLKTAEELKDFIDYILEITESEKVKIECHSLGGVVTVSYCSLYGYDKIDAIAFNSTAIYGESFTGDLFCGDIVLSNDALMAYLDFAFDANKQEELFDRIFNILDRAGLASLVATFANDLVANVGHILIPEVAVPLFAGWLTIWAMVPDEKIDEAMDFTFANYIEDNEDAAVLREKIENYNILIRENKSQTLINLDNAINIGVIARYGYSSIPATSSWQEIGDGVIDTKNASFGATTALYGSVLSDDIIENTPAEYISPDKTIDASTCLFPEKTWFIKNTKHSDGYDDLDALVAEILFSEEELTVYSSEQYPRFMIFDSKIDSIIPDTGSEADAEQGGILGFFAKIKAFVEDFFDKLRKFFGNII